MNNEELKVIYEARKIRKEAIEFVAAAEKYISYNPEDTLTKILIISRYDCMELIRRCDLIAENHNKENN